MKETKNSPTHGNEASRHSKDSQQFRAHFYANSMVKAELVQNNPKGRGQSWHHGFPKGTFQEKISY